MKFTIDSQALNTELSAAVNFHLAAEEVYHQFQEDNKY
jgi:hypothetical protein